MIYKTIEVLTSSSYYNLKILPIYSITKYQKQTDGEHKVLRLW